VLAFLSWRLPKVAEADWAARMARGEVLDEAGHPLPPETPYRPQARLWYWRTLDQETPIPFQAECLYRDESLLVVDKPHFLPMAPKGRYARETLQARLQAELGLDTLVPIHRLDRETAGVVLFSLRPADRKAYHALFSERQVRKVYEAVAPWRADVPLPQWRRSRLQTSKAHFMLVEEVAGEVNAATHIELLTHQGGWGHYRLSPHTGQTHQLRVHMNALGLPLRGDRIYPSLLPEPTAGEPEDFNAPLQLLARSIAFTDPVTGLAHRFESRRNLEFPVSGSSMSLAL